MQSAGTIDVSGRLDASLDWLTASHRRAALALLIIALICLLPGFASLPVTNRDESRFAQPARQMIETGDYIDIRLQEQSRQRKPIGIYWLQAGATRAAEALGFDNARNRIVFYRVPSLLAAIGSALLTYWAALAFVTRRYAFLAAFGLATSILLGVEARIATIDGALLLTAVAAQGALARVYLVWPPNASPRHQWKHAAIFWTGIAGSILLKGPIIPAIVILTAASLCVADRRWRWLLRLKPAAGIFWTLLLVMPWFLAIAWRSDDFFQQWPGRDLMSRLLSGAEGHWGPPGYFWLLFWVCFWPAAALAPMATAFAWAHRREPELRSLIAWIVPGWLMFEIVVTKLPHYVLPLYPGIAILIALALERKAPPDGWTKGTTFLWPVVAILLSVGVAVLAIMFEGRFGRAYWPAAAIAIVLAALAWWRFLIGQIERAFVFALIAGMTTALAVYSVLPRIQGIAVAARLVAAAKTAPCSNPALASAGYHQPNLVFLGGTETKLVSGAGAAEFLRLSGCRVAFVERRDQRAFADRAAAIGISAVRIAEVQGFDYSNFRRVSFLVLMPKEGN
ncbi:MAG: glycosyltransferase family 39 protein [Xanthobacteraceae bacterium]